MTAAARSGPPSVHSAVEGVRAAETEVNEEGSGGQESDQQDDAGDPSAGPPVAAGINDFELARENEQAEAEKNGGGGGVKDAFEDVDAEHAGGGEAVFAGDKERANRVDRATEKKNRSEADERRGVDAEERGLTEVPAEALPAKGAHSIAGEDTDEREEQKKGLGLGEGGEETIPTEALLGEGMPGTVEQRDEDDKKKDEKEELAEMATHAEGE